LTHSINERCRESWLSSPRTYFIASSTSSIRLFPYPTNPFFSTRCIWWAYPVPHKHRSAKRVLKHNHEPIQRGGLISGSKHDRKRHDRRPIWRTNIGRESFLLDGRDERPLRIVTATRSHRGSPVNSKVHVLCLIDRTSTLNLFPVNIFRDTRSFPGCRFQARPGHH
jgi:hypothetical protein